MSNPIDHSQPEPGPSPAPQGPGSKDSPGAGAAPPMESADDASALALSEALSSSFKIIKLIMAGLIVAFIASGVFTVNPNQVAVVLRFGRATGQGSEQLLKPGLHWAFPSPIDEIVRIPVGQSHTVVSSAGWFNISPEQEKAGQTPPPTRSLQPGIDNYTLTADGNIIHARATLKYRLGLEGALDYEFNFTNPTNLLQNILNNALLYASAHFTADAIIFYNKIGFREAVSRRVKQQLEEIRPGITVDSLEVETSAPLDVRSAFDEAYEAQLKAFTKRSEAETYARGATNSALGQSSNLVTSAVTHSNQLIRTVAAEAASFTAQLPYYKENPSLFKQRLLVGTLQTVMTNAQEKFFLPYRADGKPRELRLQLSREPQKPPAKETP